MGELMAMWRQMLENLNVANFGRYFHFLGANRSVVVCLSTVEARCHAVTSQFLHMVDSVSMSQTYPKKTM